ncbi:MAG: tetratricopeptide repeat protein [Bacteroidota bacterium]
MKILFCILCFFFCCSNAFAQVNLRDLKKVDDKFYTKENVLYTGDFISYDETGKLESRGNLKNGLLNGIEVTYYANGNKSSETTYKNGVTNGSNKDYYENGNLKQEVNTYNDKDDGKIIAYYETGEKHVEAFFDKGIQVGDYLEFDKQGKITRKLEFENGKATYGKKVNELVKAALTKGHSFKNDDAIALYTQAISINPTIAELYFNRGAAKANKFDFESAIVDYDKAIELYPEYKEAYANRGNAKINTFTSKGVLKPTPAQTGSACEDFYKAKELGAGESVEDMIYIYCEQNGIKPKAADKPTSGEPLIFLDTKKVIMADVSAINPNDILEITVIKTPAETAKYGPEGRNGVMLITTIKDAVKTYQKNFGDYSKDYASVASNPDNFSYTLNGILLEGKLNDIVGKLYSIKKDELKSILLKKEADKTMVNITTK